MRALLPQCRWAAAHITDKLTEIADAVDAACARALTLGTRSYSSVAAILKNNRENALAAMADAPVLIHENIRGPGYYH